eukprot:3833487-Amphidinium_carterae.1
MSCLCRDFSDAMCGGNACCFKGHSIWSQMPTLPCAFPFARLNPFALGYLWFASSSLVTFVPNQLRNLTLRPHSQLHT